MFSSMHFGNGGDGGDVVIGQAVAGVHLKPQGMGQRAPRAQRVQFGLGLVLRPSACRSE
jgi:hypothetical protein